MYAFLCAAVLVCSAAIMPLSAYAQEAQLLIKTTPAETDADFDTGDIVHAFNRKQILSTHAQVITNPRNFGFNEYNLRESGTLLDVYLQHTKEYKFERISQDSVRRTTLATGNSVIISNSPNADGEHMDVPAYLARRVKQKNHLIFGAPGSEYWYGGNDVADMDDINAIWDAIEARTDHKRSDITGYPGLDEHLEGYKVVAVEDFSDEEATELTASLVDESDPEHPDMILERKHVVQPEEIEGGEVLDLDAVVQEKEESEPDDSTEHAEEAVLDEESSGETSFFKRFFQAMRIRIASFTKIFSANAAGTIVTSIGVNDRNTNITAVSGSGPWTVTVTDGSVARIGDALWDEHATPRKYLITGISGNDLTIRDARGIGSAPDNSGTSTAQIKRFYATITLWENDLDNGVNTNMYASGDTAKGELGDDAVFTEDITINGGGSVGLASRILTSAEQDRHTGIAGTGPRIDGSIIISHSNSSYIPLEISWIEIYGGGAGGYGIRVAYSSGGSGTVNIHHNIIHDITSSAGGVYGIGYTGFSDGNIHNNIIYDITKENSGFTRTVLGINLTSSGSTKNAYNNTIYNIHNDDADAENAIGISSGEGGTVKNNIVTNVTAVGGTATDYVITAATTGTNGSEDSSGDITGLSAADLFVSTSSGTEDLHLKTGADVIDAGTDIGTSPTDVNLDIDGRDRDVENDTWDIGADEATFITGTVYSDAGTTPLTGVDVKIAVNGTAVGGIATTDGSGNYTFAARHSAGDVITAYIADETQDGVTVTVSDGSDMSGLDIYQDHLVIRHDNSGSLTNANLATAAVTSEDDISNIYSVSSGTLTMASGKTFSIASGHTFAPGGNVVLPSGYSASTGTFNLDDDTLTITGNLTVAGATIDGQTGIIDINDGSFSISSGTFTVPSTAMTVERDFTISGGTFNNSNSITFDDSSNADDTTVTYTSGTVPGTVVISKGDSGDFIVASSTTISLGAGPTTVMGNGSGGEGTYTNNGIITIASGTWTLNHGSANNTLTRFLTNNGTITHGGNGWDINDMGLTNNGTITYSGTAITMERSFTQSGTFNLTGITITFDGVGFGDSAVITSSGPLGGTVVLATTFITVANGTSISLGASPTTTVPSTSCTYTNNGTIVIPSGTWTMDITRNCTITNNGTITHDGTGWDMNFSGAFNSSSFINAAGGTITYAGTSITTELDFTQNGTFDLSGKTITFDGTSSVDNSVLTCGTTIQGNVTVNKTSTNTFTLGSNCTIAGNFTRTDGAISNPSSPYTLTVEGNISTTTTDTFGGANLTLTMGGSGNQTFTDNTGVTIASPFKVDKSAGTASLATNMTTGSTCNIVEGTFDINGKTFTCGSTFTVEDGGTLERFGTSGESVTTPTLASGSTVTYTGDGDSASDTITITSMATQYHHLTINSTDGTSDTFQLGAALDVNGNLTITSGILDVTTSNYGITVGGNFSNSGTFTARSGTLTFDAASGTQTLNAGASSLYNLTHSGAGTLQLVSNDLTVTNNLVNSAGILDANGFDINVAGTWNNTGGTFTAGNNTVTLDGTDQSILGSTTFYNLVKTVSSAATLTFEAAKTQIIQGALTLQGALGNLLSLVSSIPGTQWLFNPQGTATLEHLDIQDADNDNASAVTADNSHNSGNNTNITFSATTVTWTGATDTDWGTATNWDVGYVPNATDNVVIANVTNDPVLDENRTVNNLTINSGGALDVSASNYALTVTGNFTNNGTFTARSGTVTLTGTSSHTLTSGGSSFYNLTQNGSGGTYTLQDNLTVTHVLTITAGTFNASSRTITLSGNLANPFVVNGTFTPGTSTVIYSGDNQDGLWDFTAVRPVTYYNLTFNNAAEEFRLTGSTTVQNNLTITAGTFTSGSDQYPLSVGGNWSNAGTYIANNNTVTLTGTSSHTLTSGGSSFYNLVQNGSGGTYTLQDALIATNNLTITAGTLDVKSGSNFAVSAGAWSNSGTFVPRNGTLTVTKTSTFSDTTSFYNVTINGSGQTVTLGAALNVTNTLTITAGTLDASSRTITLSGTTGTPFTNSGTFTPSTSTVSYTGNNGSGNTTIANVTYNNLTLNNASETFVLAGATTLNGNLTITAGTLDVVSGQNYALSVGGNFSNAGTFAAQSGTVTLTGMGTHTLTSNSSSFSTLVLNGSGGTYTLQDDLATAADLTITAGTLSVAGNDVAASGTFTNAGTLQLNGTETTVATPSDLTSSGTIAYNNTGSVSSFLFGNEYYHLTLGGSGTVTLNAALTVNGNLTITNGSTLDFNEYDVEIKGNFTNNGTLVDADTRTFTLSGTTQLFSPSNITIGALALTGSSGTVSLGSNFTLGNVLSVAAGRILSLVTYAIDAAAASLTNLGTINEGTGALEHDSTNFYIADSSFDEDSLIGLGGEKVYITMMDEDGNLNGSVADTLSGVVVSCPTDSEAVTLTETGNATELFRNSGLTTALYEGSASNNDGTLACSDGATITATYTDPQDASDTQSDTASATSTTPPTAPSGFAGTSPSSASITWTWTDNSSNETGFKLYDASNNLIATINTANATSYTETGLTKGVSYTRKLAAYNTVGNSTFTSSATVTTLAEPAAPSSFSGIAASDTSITWTWTDNAVDEDGFKLLDEDGTVIATIATANTTSYTETNLVSDTSYTRKIAAYNSDGTSAASNTATVSLSTTASNPTSFALLSPANNALVATGLPTFSFRKSTVSSGTISSYTLFVGQRSFAGIAPSGSAASNPAAGIDYENTFTARYSGENDGDPTNDVITVTLVDGSDIVPIPDGTYAWYVRANASDGATATTDSRTIHVDATAPDISSISLSPASAKDSAGRPGFTTTDTSPTLSMTATDGRALSEATVVLERANKALAIITSYTPLETRTYSLVGRSAEISFTPRNALALGSSYRYTITVTDAAGHSTTQTITLDALSPEQQARERIAELDPDTTDTDTIIEALRETLPESPISLPDLEAHAAVRLERQAEEFNKFLAVIEPFFERIFGGTQNITGSFLSRIASVLHGVDTGSRALLARVSDALGRSGNSFLIRIAALLEDINIESARIAQGMAQRVVSFKESIFTSDILLGVRTAFLDTVRSFQDRRFALEMQRQENRRQVFSWNYSLSDRTKGFLSRIAEVLQEGRKVRVAQGLKNRQAIDRAVQRVILPVREGASRIALKSRAVYEIVFDSTPTRISRVRITSLTPTEAVVEWDTNHLTRSGKVNYGTYANQAYDKEAFEEEGLHEHHRVVLTDLAPNTTYYFEVMNQNGGYVYDAYYALTTPSESEASSNTQLAPQVAVIRTATSAYSAPDPNAVELLPLHAGEEFRALLIQGDWVSILLPDRRQGWVQREDVGLRNAE